MEGVKVTMYSLAFLLYTIIPYLIIYLKKKSINKDFSSYVSHNIVNYKENF